MNACVGLSIPPWHIAGGGVSRSSFGLTLKFHFANETGKSSQEGPNGVCVRTCVPACMCVMCTFVRVCVCACPGGR